MESGNIDLTNRPRIINPNGSVSSVRSIGITAQDGKFVLIPTAVDGRILLDQDAINHWKQTIGPGKKYGDNLGVDDTQAASDARGGQLYMSQKQQN